MSALVMAMLLTGAGGLAEAQAGAQAPVPPPPMVVMRPAAPAAPSYPPLLIGELLTDYLTPADYPAGAMPAHAYGGVFFRLEIDADGRVTRCTVTGGSAPPALAQTTCRALAGRARYHPALDAARQPVASTTEGRVVWRAPGAAGEPLEILVPQSPPAPPAPSGYAPPRYAVPVAPPAPPPAPRVVPPQRAMANLASYFSADDYPTAAQRAHHEGQTSFTLTIDATGRVSDCRVSRSSGSQPLDAATCRIIRSRARYTPARGYDGRPTTGRDYGRVTWRLPGPPADRAGLGMAYVPARALPPHADEVSAADIPPGEPKPAGDARAGLRVAIGREGQVIGCDIQNSSGSPALDAAACRLYTARARYEPGRNQLGAAVCDVVWTAVDWSEAFAARPPAPAGARASAVKPPRPLREQLNATLCPGWASPWHPRAPRAQASLIMDISRPLGLIAS